MKKFEFEAAVLTGLFLIVALGYAGASAVVHARSRAECLAAGYPTAYVTWKREAYCVRRVEQTDIVEPLAKVRRERS